MVGFVLLYYDLIKLRSYNAELSTPRPHPCELTHCTFVLLNPSLDEIATWLITERECALHWKYLLKLWNRFIFLLVSFFCSFFHFAFLVTSPFRPLWNQHPLHKHVLLIAINTRYALFSRRLNPARELQKQCWCLLLCLPFAGCLTTSSTYTALLHTMLP